MEELTCCFLASEAEYIAKFCELYKDEINTPDGFHVVCLNPEKQAKHFCRGSDGRFFQKARAVRICWASYILLNVECRKVLLDTSTNNVIFFFEKGKTSYAVVCSQLKNSKLNLISGFIASGARAIAYREVKPPYKFYSIKKSC